MTADDTLPNAFLGSPLATPRIATAYRTIQTSLPSPSTAADIARAARLFPRANCYQVPVIWDTADGFTVADRDGNRWIDFTSTAVLTNTGHGHPAIREAVAQHVSGSGLMAQFSFASDIRIELAERLVDLAPEHCDKVHFWTVGSEAIECALRLAREHGLAHGSSKFHVLTHSADYHGWTLGAHQLSGQSAGKPWLATPDSAMHHIRFPDAEPGIRESANSLPASHRTADDWDQYVLESVRMLGEGGPDADDVCAIFIETMQGWGAVPMPKGYVQALRRWADQNRALLIFDEVQTGFARTGRLLAHEHYEVKADLICVGKGLTSSLPLAAVLGASEVLDLIPPGEVTTTHAAHPVSCAAALANLAIIENEGLIEEAQRKGQIAHEALKQLQSENPEYVAHVEGLGLLRAIHIRNPETGVLCKQTARRWTEAGVAHGVMLFQVNRPSIKVCPPLVIDDAAIEEGVAALGDALKSLNSN